MPTAAVTRYDTKKIIAGTPGQIWAGLSVPPNGSRIVLDPVTHTPDLTANPNAVHLGMTKEGTTATFELSKTDYYADEFPFPIKTVIEQINGRLEGSFLQILDFEILKYLTSGFGTVTPLPPAGIAELTLGVTPLSYTSVALIFPTEENPDKYAVIHLYDAVNTGGLAFQVSRKSMAEAAFKFEGRALGNRNKVDSFGNYWAEVGRTFSSPGVSSWIAPEGVTSVTVECTGGGGAGGSGNAGEYGGGGGAGGKATKEVTVIPGNSYTVHVGAGGTGTVMSGNAGDMSWFSTSSTVRGDGGGGGDSAIIDAFGGAGGSGLGDTVTEGASGHAGFAGGGGGAGEFGAGGAGSTGTTGSAGASGAVKII